METTKKFKVMKNSIEKACGELISTNQTVITCRPQTKDELKELIRTRIKNEGPECDLNNIDVSELLICLIYLLSLTSTGHL